MKRFTAKIVDLMKQEKLYASQGGPIILSQVNTLLSVDAQFLCQIENENFYVFMSD